MLAFFDFSCRVAFFDLSPSIRASKKGADTLRAKPRHYPTATKKKKNYPTQNPNFPQKRTQNPNYHHFISTTAPCSMHASKQNLQHKHQLPIMHATDRRGHDSKMTSDTYATSYHLPAPGAKIPISCEPFFLFLQIRSPAKPCRQITSPNQSRRESNISGPEIAMGARVLPSFAAKHAHAISSPSPP